MTTEGKNVIPTAAPKDDAEPDEFTATVKTPAAAASTEPGAPNPGQIVLRGIPVTLISEVGKAFVADCARNTEGLLSDAEVKDKWGLIDEDWAGLAGNAPVLAAVRAERDRRVASGLAAKEAAQRHFARAQTVLGDILNDEQVAPRHRIEAARELRQVAGSGPENPLAGEKVSIIINMGDEQFVKEFIQGPVRSDDGELR